jgi:hypothetical protein
VAGETPCAATCQIVKIRTRWSCCARGFGNPATALKARIADEGGHIGGLASRVSRRKVTAKRLQTHVNEVIWLGHDDLPEPMLSRMRRDPTTCLHSWRFGRPRMSAWMPRAKRKGTQTQSHPLKRMPAPALAGCCGWPAGAMASLLIPAIYRVVMMTCARTVNS